jgi:hypothetical protein
LYNASSTIAIGTGRKEFKQCRILVSIGCHVVGTNIDDTKWTRISRRSQQALAQALRAMVGKDAPSVSAELDQSMEIRIIIIDLLKQTPKVRAFVIPSWWTDHIHDDDNSGDQKK